jgi:transposase
MGHSTLLNSEQKLELNTYIKNKDRSVVEIRRAQTILMLDANAELFFIQQITGYKRRAIFTFRRRYLRYGLVGIKDKRKGNAKKLLTRIQRLEVVEMLTQTDPKAHGYDHAYWTTSILGDLIKHKYRVHYKSKTSYYVLFKQSKLSFHKPGKVYEKNDPKKVDAWRKEMNPKLTAAMRNQAIVILAADEMILSSQTTFQKIWLPKGTYPKIEVSNTRVNRSIYGFVNIKTGQAHAYKKERQNMFITVECLIELRKQYPAKKLLIFWDGAGWHRGSEVQKFIKEDAKIETIYFPPYSPEENPQEHVWKAARSSVSHNRFIDKIDQVADEFVNYISV